MKKLFAAFALAAALAAGLTPVAGASQGLPSVAGQLADIAVINQTTGERLRVWRHDGRSYVAGNPGDRYAIEVRNRSGARILSVVSVDGMNAVSGQTAAPSQSGYVLAAWQQMLVKGWRKSLDDVAAFYFTRLPDSYAARTGRPDNVGVIGVAIFREYVEPVAIYERRRMEAPVSSAASEQSDLLGARASKKASVEDRLGTGHGERIGSSVGTTEFRRASERPAEIISIYYQTRAQLAAHGIIPGGYHRELTPSAFPGRFVPDPS